MTTLRKAPLFFSLLTVGALALGGVASAQDATAVPSVPIKISAMGPFTGPAASIGTEQLNWAKLAVEDFNKATGWSVELVESDTQLDAAKAVTVADSVIADSDIYGVVGPAGSQEVAAIAKQMEDAHLVHISGSATNPDLSSSGITTFFRVVPTDLAQGPTDGEYLYEVLGVKSIYVVDDQSSYAVGLADQATKAFEDEGGTIAGRESVTQQDTDFSSLVTKIKATGAEAVFFPGQIASQGAIFARNMKEQGYDAVLFGADGFFSVDDLIKGAAGATEGTYVSAFAPDIHNLESSADIVKRYTDEYGEFGTFGPPNYAATMVILQAIQRAYEAGTLTREAVRDEVAKTDIEQSVLGGPLSFDEHGDVKNAAFYIFQVKGDNFVSIPLPGADSVTGMTSTMEPMATADMMATAEATP